MSAASSAADMLPGDIVVVRHPTARRARLSVDPASGRVRLVLPRRASLASVRRWVADHRGWIEAQRARLPRAVPFTSGAVIPFGDERLTIDWDERHPRTVARDGDRLVCGGPAAALPRRIEAWLRRQALDVLTRETAHYAARAGVTIAQVAIGDPRARWGSCSADGRIRYSWRLILAPAAVRRSTVAHEVAHRLHMHHGPAFHAAADALFEGDHEAARAWLRANGAALHWIGRAAA